MSEPKYVTLRAEAQTTETGKLVAELVNDTAVEQVTMAIVGPDLHVEAFRAGGLWREVVFGLHGGELNDSGWIENPWKVEP